MKYFIYTLILSLAFLFSCNNAKIKPTFFSQFTTDSLSVQQFTIDNTKDTLLYTANGTWIKIEKGSFNSSTNNVALEIKEAISVEQIIKAGLSTQSNGMPLSSGGMLYMNAKDEKVTIAKPIKIAIPTKFVDKNMQVFKGEKDEEGKINWTNPKPTFEDAVSKLLLNGKALYEQKCASCHAIGKEGAFGPDLANIRKRNYVYEGEGGLSSTGVLHDFKKLRYYYKRNISDSIKLTDYYYDSTHPYINNYDCNLIKMYKDSGVDLTNELKGLQQKIIQTYYYIQNESDKNNLPLPKHAYLDDCIDSCNIYKQLKESTNKKLELEYLKREGLFNSNGSFVTNINRIDQRNITESKIDTPPPPPNFKDKVEPENIQSLYYQFTIETFGWYNIDVLVKDVDGVKESELFVRIIGAYKEKISLSLIIPSSKINVQGGKAKDDNYAFDDKSGKIALPQNRKAYILAVTETSGLLAYSIQEFTITEKQTITIELKKVTKEEFNAAVKNIEVEGLKINASDNKNASDIRKADTAIQKLNIDLQNIEKFKPKNCDCDCGSELLPEKTLKAIANTQSEPIWADEGNVNSDF